MSVCKYVWTMYCNLHETATPDISASTLTQFTLFTLVPPEELKTEKNAVLPPVHSQCAASTWPPPELYGVGVGVDKVVAVGILRDSHPVVAASVEDVRQPRYERLDLLVPENNENDRASALAKGRNLKRDKQRNKQRVHSPGFNWCRKKARC